MYWSPAAWWTRPLWSAWRMTVRPGADRWVQRPVREVEGRMYPGVLNGQTGKPAAFVGQLGHQHPDRPARVRGKPCARDREGDREAGAERGERRGGARLVAGTQAADGVAEQLDR